MLKAAQSQSALPGAPGEDGGLSDDADFTESLLDRAFACQDASPVIGPAADLAAVFLKEGRNLAIPSALDERDTAGGTESTRSVQLRRLLITQLLTLTPDNGAPVHWLLWSWKPSQLAEDTYTQALRRGEEPAPLPGQRHKPGERSANRSHRFRPWIFGPEIRRHGRIADDGNEP